MSWLYFCRAAGAQQPLPEPGGKSQVGGGSGALKPLAQCDSLSPSAVSYSPVDSCCFHGNGALGPANSPPGQQGERGAALQGVHSSAWRVRADSPPLGAEEQGRGSLRGGTQTPPGRLQQGRRSRIPPPAAPWRGRQRGSIIRVVLLGGEGLVPGHLQPSSGSGGVSISWGKA